MGAAQIAYGEGGIKDLVQDFMVGKPGSVWEKVDSRIIHLSIDQLYIVQ